MSALSEYIRAERIAAGAVALVEAVERYVEPKPGAEYFSREALLNIKNNLKTLLTK